MTEKQARLIANAAVHVHKAKATLQRSEQLGQYKSSREHRDAVSQAERHLVEAIEAVAE